MTTRLDRLRGAAPRQERSDLLDGLLAGSLFGSPVTTWGNTPVEKIDGTFAGLAAGAFKSSGVVFAVMLARHLLFTEVRFQWQEVKHGRPGRLFGSDELSVLEEPWRNGTTGSLLARMEQDVSLAGNFFGVRTQNSIRRLKPTHVSIVVGSLSGDPHDLDSQPKGYVYQPPGKKPITLAVDDVCHYAPIPDPTSSYRGMSWLTPVVREIQADVGATKHKEKFFQNAATPNMAVSLDKAVTKEQFTDFVKVMREQHEGADNAYKTLYLAGGADVTVVGADMKQLDFKATQGAGETRICAAGGVPPVIVGLSEGLASATYSNYGMARRLFGDHWARPQWRQAAAALQSILRPPAGARLWYDDSDVAFLQEDRADDAEIAQKQATTIETLIRAGYQPATVVDAVMTGDWTLLEHTGLYSVQLVPPKPGVPDLASATTEETS